MKRRDLEGGALARAIGDAGIRRRAVVAAQRGQGAGALQLLVIERLDPMDLGIDAEPLGDDLVAGVAQPLTERG